MRARKTFRCVALVVIVLVAVFLLLPWKSFLEKKLAAAFEAKGFAPATLSIDHIGWRGVVLQQVALGDPALKLDSLTVGYQPLALLKGRIEDVEVNGLTVNILQDQSVWKIDGIGGLPHRKLPTEPTKIPVTLAALNALPMRNISLRDATIAVTRGNMQAQLPLEGMLQHEEDVTLHLESKNATIVMNGDTISIAAITIDLTLDDTKQQWHGTWKIDSVTSNTESLPLPKINAAGELTITQDTLVATGNLASIDKTSTATFNVNYALNNPAASLATITQARMPLSGGTVGLHNMRVPLNGTKPIALTLEVNNLAVDNVLQTLTGSKATGTGAVSGKVPLTITRDGALRVGKSSLTADAPGTIALSPDAIPGDNPQVALVREVLKNLHYTVLALGLEMPPGGNLAATLAVEGRNPDVENGRAIKLQVHLSGDLLNLILQNLKLMTDPKTFIEQNTHEKH